MRIMTRNATDPGIGSVKALAVRQPVGLKAHINFTAPFPTHHHLPTAVALSAKI